MIISIHQPAYFPWMPYFDRIKASDVHVILDHVQFIRDDFIQRQRVSGSWMTIPVTNKAAPINEVLIDNSRPWWLKHRKTAIQQGCLTEDEARVLIHPYSRLSLLLNAQLYYFRALLNIDTELQFSSNHAFTAHKSDLVLEICQFFGADQYLSGPMGRDYLDLEAFERAEIEVIFDAPQSTETILEYMKSEKERF